MEETATLRLGTFDNDGDKRGDRGLSSVLTSKQIKKV